MKNISGLIFILISLSIFFVIFCIYTLALEFITKSTIGKMVCGLQVLSVKETLSFYQILLRNIAKPFDLVLVVGCLVMYFTKNNRRLGDIISQTYIDFRE